MPGAGGCEGPLRGGDQDRTGALGAGLVTDDDLDVAVEGVEEAQEALDGETFKAVIGQGGNLRLIQIEEFRRRRLPQPFLFKNLVNRHCQAYLRQLFIRIA